MTTEKRQARATLAATAGTALFVYSLTVAPGLTWANFGADGGELITAAATLGVPHPPGYPTYVLLGKLVSLIPFGEMAYRFNLFSAVCMTVAATAVAGAVAHYKPEGSPRPLGLNAPAVAAGLAVAFSPLVWSQAVITEVYGLNLAVIGLALWALTAQKSPLTVGLLFGLSLTTHLTSWLLLPLLLWLLPRRNWQLTAVGALLGLTPLALIPLFARSGSPIVWGDPTTPSGWFWLVSGQLYHANLFALPGAELWRRGGAWALELGGQLTWAAPILLLWSWRRASLDWRRWQMGLGGTAALYVLHAWLNGSQDALIFLLPAVPLVVLLMRPAWEGLGWFSLLVPLALIGLNFEQQNLANENWVRPLLEETLADTPPNAILIASGDETYFGLRYAQQALGLRPDVVVVEENLFAFGWYRAHLGRRYADLFMPEADDLALFTAVNGAARPILWVNLVENRS